MGVRRPILELLPLQSGQRIHGLRQVFNALRWLVRTASPWRMLPHDFPPWAAVYQETHRWFKVGCFEAIAHDLRVLLWQAERRHRKRRYWTAASCSRVARAVRAPAMTAPNDARAPSCTWRWTPWAIRWLCIYARRRTGSRPSRLTDRGGAAYQCPPRPSGPRRLGLHRPKRSVSGLPA